VHALRKVNLDSAVVDQDVVHFEKRAFRTLFVGERDERETQGVACFVIANDVA
jgi:hypothetical protein